MEIIHWLLNKMDLQMCLVLVTAFLIGLWLIDLKHSRSMPPGPFQWPFIGCLPQLAMFGANDLLGYLMKLSRKYNGFFSLKLGNYHAVFISDLKMIQEAFVKQSNCFNDRPMNSQVFHLITDNKQHKGWFQYVISILYYMYLNCIYDPRKKELKSINYYQI